MVQKSIKRSIRTNNINANIPTIIVVSIFVFLLFAIICALIYVNIKQKKLLNKKIKDSSSINKYKLIQDDDVDKDQINLKQEVQEDNITTTYTRLLPEPPIVLDKSSLADNGPIVYPTHNPKYPLRGEISEYQQVGVLVSKEDNDFQPVILPLFGRRMLTKDRWEYYVASDNNHMFRLPIIYQNYDCQEDTGCDNIRNNAQDIKVPDYGDRIFKARIYKNVGMRN